jgi:hypothetical protein
MYSHINLTIWYAYLTGCSLKPASVKKKLIISANKTHTSYLYIKQDTYLLPLYQTRHIPLTFTSNKTHTSYLYIKQDTYLLPLHQTRHIPLTFISNKKHTSYLYIKQDTYFLPLYQTPAFLFSLCNTSHIHLLLHQLSIDQLQIYSAACDMHPQSGRE